jgi:Icc-related predicted phosphoesterase
VYAVSDLHVDFPANMRWVESIPTGAYTQDTLVVAGDVSDNLHRLGHALAMLRERFARVFFVPGNHELWCRRGYPDDSLEKFDQVLSLCKALDVTTTPTRLSSAHNDDAIWVVPLHSWYVMPEEGDDGLYIEKPGEDPELTGWADLHFFRWPESRSHVRPADLFLDLNERHLDQSVDAPVLSFSHFLPRTELLRHSAEERERLGANPVDPHPEFNFSRVAGCRRIENQLRRIGSRIHVYGHQHRNRWREIDGVLYVSNCLGYPGERREAGGAARRLLQVWGGNGGRSAISHPARRVVRTS